MRHLKRRAGLGLALAMLAVVLAGCPGGGGDGGGDNGDGTDNGNGNGNGNGGGIILEPSAGITSIDPDTASPGVPVRIVAAGPAFAVGSTTSVDVNGQIAVIETRISDTEAEVLVPNVSAGSALVRLIEAGKAPGPVSQFNVTRALSERLVLEFANNQAQLVAVQRSAGSAGEGSQELGRRLSYDVVDAISAQVLFTQSINHPTLGRSEIYDEPAPGIRVLRGDPPPARATFAVKIPKYDRVVRVLFYDAAAGLDLTTEAGRGARVFLNQLLVGGQP